ncbi:MAG TPA: undecaprenyl-diphosphatase UppP [Anaerolineae bacterium]|nr:undecaprenyl-diphosphatase UppP [Anaerolineae bacterium]MCB0223650.1 undecaprenyl-diphosphatase UppP [Anaerolineae bacterium]HRV92922.1 undecaprenyl-diphosphatase UppP [Anaerolineae bacterium]
MDLLQAFILGLVQGATEYIPVSSSAHLILVPWFLGWPDPSFEFEVLVQWGTLVGVFIFFWQDIWAIARGVLQGLAQRQPLATFEARLGWFVVIATIPAVVLGLLFKDFFEAAFAAPAVAGGLLILTAILLTVAEYFGSRAKELENLTWLDALIIGFWQAAAIMPGISRSGATIGGAVIQGFNRPAAARFSFLMSIPALFGAGLVALVDLLGEGTLAAQLPAITVGFIAAAVSGYICIRWLLHYLQRHSLYVFAIYCAALSILSIVVGLMRG